jgi:hypothetical protein
MNEMIELIDHIHNVISFILLKYHTGIELTEDEEEVISQLYISSENGNLKSLEDIPHKNNNYINTIIMSRTKGAKNKVITLNNNNMNKNLDLDLNEVVLNLNGTPFGNADSSYNKVIEIIMTPGATLETVYKFCQSQLANEPMTIGKAIKFAILNSEENKKTPENSYESYKLAMKIESKDPEFSTEDLGAFKKSVGEVFKKTPEVLGFIWNAIENK